ncbi:MAG: 4-alpha-glucanotransferase [Pseudomonadota bacterium]
MDDPNATLFQLAAEAGIEAGFHDAFGTHHPLHAETAIRILGALGLPAETDRQQQASLAALQERPWRCGLPGSLVVPAEQQPAEIPLHVPADCAIARWQIVEEGGQRHEGGLDLLDYPVDDERKVDGQRMVRRDCRLGVALPEGYHRLAVALGENTLECLLIVAPKLCWLPEDAAPGRRLWGVACQLYSLRGRLSNGIGNLDDLAALVGYAAGCGADLVGLNPLHALSPADPERRSPYSPASRDFLNVLYIDPRSVPEVTASATARALLSGQRQAALAQLDLIDYPGVTRLLLDVMRAAFENWPLASAERHASFAAFRAQGGTALETFARFMAIQERLAADSATMIDWRNWPEGLRCADGAYVGHFAAQHADAVTFHAWLQWLADEQLANAAACADGMAVGLYRDLAVGVGPDSAAAWAAGDSLASGVSVGAPPDLLNRLGQNWGLVPFNPLALAEGGYAPWIEALRANMRHAGALRVDHAMALLHGFWIPEGLDATRGAYVAFPLESLTRILALESRRHRCIVVGEDLGTVPPGFRDKMAESGVLSYRLMLFERVGEGLFARPETYPENALVMFATHDLPTLAGFWSGEDLDLRQELRQYPSDEVRDTDVADRTADRRRLIDALIDAGLWSHDTPVLDQAGMLSSELAKAVQLYLARTPSRLMMVQLEDLLRLPEMVNLPGTVDQHPNWRRRLPVDLATLFSMPQVTDQFHAVNAERRRSPTDNGSH